MAQKKKPARKPPPKPPARKPASKAAAKPTPRKPHASKAATKPAASKPAANEPRAKLLALSADYEEMVDIPVAEILKDAKELQGLLKKLGQRIVEKSRMEAAVIAGFGGWVTVLDEAELEWASLRQLQLPSGRKKLRAEAEAIKKDAIAALRHFLAKDATLQAKIDAIVEGSGLADLIDDLKKLRPLVAAHQPALARSDLPPNAADRLKELADALDAATETEGVERAGSDEARLAQRLRNRSYWWLRETMDEIRECAHYAFRKEPALAKLFRSPYTRKSKKPAPKPTKDSPLPRLSVVSPPPELRCPPPKPRHPPPLATRALGSGLPSPALACACPDLVGAIP